jgi:hypothetical protein
VEVKNSSVLISLLPLFWETVWVAKVQARKRFPTRRVQQGLSLSVKLIDLKQVLKAQI